jgi:hypothetical protein
VTSLIVPPIGAIGAIRGVETKKSMDSSGKVV